MERLGNGGYRAGRRAGRRATRVIVGVARERRAFAAAVARRSRAGEARGRSEQSMALQDTQNPNMGVDDEHAGAGRGE